MHKPSVTVSWVCCLAITAASCARNPKPSQNPQTPPITQTGRICPPLAQLGGIRPLACYIDGNHMLAVGNSSAKAIPEGTRVSFVAKLENAGAHCATVPAPRPIPPHLYITITGQPLFDDEAPCQAWLEVPPVVSQ